MHVVARIGSGAALMAASLAVAVLLAEAALRIYHWTEGRPLFDDAPFLVQDARLGWRPNGNLSIERSLTDASGTAYRARVTTDRAGFRRVADGGDRPRILFIGDSFTHAVEVGDDRAYYAVFARRHPDHAVFAIGAGGYGTLQEALLLEQVAPRVQPDIVIWQLCDNDLTNNLFEGERRSVRHNSLMRRPYWEGAVVYRNPAPWIFARMDDWYRAAGLRILKVAQVRGHLLLSALRGRTDEDGFAGTGGAGLRRRAIAVTTEILRRSRADGRTHLSFNVCASAGADLRAISEASGLHFLADYGPQIAARRADREVYARDGRHLNEDGHAMLGELLAADFGSWLGRNDAAVARAVRPAPPIKPLASAAGSETPAVPGRGGPGAGRSR
jgi:GDSL-like Lipase/Acylhydrolase family